jgi:hypothetical protein
MEQHDHRSLMIDDADRLRSAHMGRSAAVGRDTCHDDTRSRNYVALDVIYYELLLAATEQPSSRLDLKKGADANVRTSQPGDPKTAFQEYAGSDIQRRVRTAWQLAPRCNDLHIPIIISDAVERY